MRLRLTLVSLAVLFAIAAPVGAQIPSTAPAASADHPVTAPTGATLTAPSGWSEATQAPLYQLASPEGDFFLAVFDAGAAADAPAAVSAAWQAWGPSKSRPPKLVTPRPARNGWDERVLIDYETSPNEKLALQAVAFRAGDHWTVVLVAGNEATAEKRLGAVNLALGSLRPAGYSRESFAGKTAHPMDEARIAQLRAFVEESMKELGVPGASFSLTTRDRTIYSTGLGVRALGKPTPVDADSEFMIASNTKGMSTLLLAKLVDEGKIGWEQPVQQVYPTFRLGSTETTAKVEIKHLVCACTGLPRKDMQLLFNTAADTPASDTFVQLAATEPTSGFGETFQYNNLMASAAGYIGGHLVHPDLELGRAYDQAMQEKVFKPLGMTATTFDYARAMSKDWAQPNSTGLDGGPAALGAEGLTFNEMFRPFRPAGGAWSTANDLIKYVRFELNEGKLDDGTQYVTQKNLLQRRVPNVGIGEDLTYGMGLEVNRSYGIDVVSHGGSLGGYKSDILIIPAADIGAVILTSADNGQLLLRPFMRRLLELLYDGKPEAVGDVAAAAKRQDAEMADERQRVSPVPDAAAVKALASHYSNADLGELRVVKKGTGVVFKFRSLSLAMGTRKNEDGTVSFVVVEPTLLYFPLVVGTDGGKPTLTLRDAQHEFVFVTSKARGS